MVVVLASLLVLLALPAPVVAGDLQAVKERGRLVVLCWPHQESIFVRQMVELGEEGLRTFGGIDVELAQAFAESLGVEAEMKAVSPDFAALIPSLLAGDGDLVASSLSITEERAKKVAFSVPYFEVRKVVVTRKGKGLRTTADLDGKTAAVAIGTSHHEYLRRLGFGRDRLRAIQFMLDNYRMVAAGEVDFTVVDSTSASRVLGEYPDLGEALEVAFAFPEQDFFGMAVRPGSDLLPVLDRFLSEMKESSELERIIGKYLSAD